MVQQHVAVGVLVAQPFQRGQRIGVGGERTRLACQARHQQRIEKRGVTVGEQVFEFGHRLQRLGRHRVVHADAYVHVVMRGHVPFERRKDDLAGIAASGLRRFDERHFVLGHAGGKRHGSAGKRRTACSGRRPGPARFPG
ncbi:hypothetical protein G6F57_020761 [Rhizopus arrhizus]|nr:hypothetical protein G6F57_020761 [Rhizopus arrhizus]